MKLRTKYKIQIPDTSNLVYTTALNTKISEVEENGAVHPK